MASHLTDIFNLPIIRTTMLASHFSKFLEQHHSPSSPEFRPLVHQLCELTDSGSSCLDLCQLTQYSLEEWNTLLDCDGEKSAVSSPGGSTPLILTPDGKIYLQRYYLHEQHVFNAIDRASRTPCDKISDATLKRVEKLFVTLENNDQASAALCALKNRLSIISGGPGTGKTTTVVKILQLLHESGHYNHPSDCLLLAPTGKAADRLKQSVVEGLKRTNQPSENIPTDTSTIHRALGYKQGSIEFRHNANNPLNAKVVVIDETSMVDLPLIARLMDAISDQTRIILLGDKNQLASIQVGTVLSDLMEASQSTKHPILQCSVTLRKSYRTLGAISATCDAIRDGDSDLAWKTIQDSTANPELEGTIFQTPPPSQLRTALTSFVLQHWLPVLRNEELDELEKIQQIDRFRILTPTHRGPYGVQAVNQIIDQILSSHGIPKRDIWYHGRSVIVQQNDYALGIYNGDIGLTLEDSHKENSAINVYFRTGDELKKIPPTLLPQCNTAWALTIHRTQGSEYDHILLIIPPSEDSKILSRELLYTGLSRAKISATLWCSEESLRQTINTTIQRASGLSDMFSDK